jgi:hypothetical protein
MVPQWDRWLNIKGDKQKVWYAPSANHVPCAYGSQNKLLCIRDFVNSCSVTPLYIRLTQAW